MLELGITRVEIGVQTLSENVYKNTNRGHTIQDVYRIVSNCKRRWLQNCGSYDAWITRF